MSSNQTVMTLDLPLKYNEHHKEIISAFELNNDAMIKKIKEIIIGSKNEVSLLN